MYKCSLCGNELSKLTRGPLETPHFYALPALEVDDQGNYNRSEHRSLYLSAWGCQKCGHVHFFLAKLTGEINEGPIRYNQP